MKNMIKVLALTLVLVLSISLLVPAFAESGNRTVTFSLSLRQNWIWALYGLDVFIDGTKVQTLGQGDIAYFNAVLTGGWHTIAFKGTDGYTYNSKNIYLGNLSDGTTVNITLQTHEAYIETRSFSVNGKTQSVIDPSTSGDLIDTAGKLVAIVSMF